MSTTKLTVYNQILDILDGSPDGEWVSKSSITKTLVEVSSPALPTSQNLSPPFQLLLFPLLVNNITVLSNSTPLLPRTTEAPRSTSSRGPSSRGLRRSS